MKVVELRSTRDLLRDVEDLRQRVLRGRIKAYAVSITDIDGQEAIYLGGTHKTDAAAALRASMAVSWAMTELEEANRTERRTG